VSGPLDRAPDEMLRRDDAGSVRVETWGRNGAERLGLYPLRQPVLKSHERVARPTMEHAMDDTPLALRLTLVDFVGTAYPGSRRVRIVESPSELPPALERIALEAQTKSHAWLAWIEDEHTRFVAGEIVELVQPAECDAHGLRVHFHDDEGRLLASATWARDADGRWRLWNP
jgi:hypothetical protein